MEINPDSQEKEIKSIPYYYIDFENDKAKIIEIREKIMQIAEKKFNHPIKVKKEILGQDTLSIKNSQSNIDISKSFILGPDKCSSKNLSCRIF